MLTETQKQEFSEAGFTSLPGALPPELVNRMSDRIWKTLENRKGFMRHEPKTWVPGGVRGIGDINKDPIFRPFGSPQLFSCIDDLLGEGKWKQPSSWGQILVTFPAPQWSWNSLFQDQVEVDKITWHTDYPFNTPVDQLAGVQVFCLLGDLSTGGGGTLVASGSHRLVANFVCEQPIEALQKMKRVRLALIESSPWLQSVSDAISVPRPEEWFSEQQSVENGIPLAVHELTGKAGDVYLTHPWLLHSMSPNCNATPRIMCTQRIYLEGMTRC